MTIDIPALLRDAIEAAADASIEVAVMGGCARNAYAEARATRDVDLVAAVEPALHDKFLAAMAQRGFSPATIVGEGDHVVPDLILFRDAGGRRIDVLYAHTDFEREALARRLEGEPYRGLTVPVITVEDLIVYKLIADRAQDRADIEHVVFARKLAAEAIDWARVEGWAEAWGVADRLRRVGR